MSKVKAVIEFPEDILISLKESKEDFIQNLKIFAALEFYKRKKLSLGKAAEFVDMSRLEFAELLNKSRIPVIDLSSDELKKEIAFSKERANK